MYIFKCFHFFIGITTTLKFYPIISWKSKSFDNLAKASFKIYRDLFCI